MSVLMLTAPVLKVAVLEREILIIHRKTYLKGLRAN